MQWFCYCIITNKRGLLYIIKHIYCVHGGSYSLRYKNWKNTKLELLCLDLLENNQKILTLPEYLNCDTLFFTLYKGKVWILLVTGEECVASACLLFLPFFGSIGWTFFEASVVFGEDIEWCSGWVGGKLDADELCLSVSFSTSVTLVLVVIWWFLEALPVAEPVFVALAIELFWSKVVIGVATVVSW